MRLWIFDFDGTTATNASNRSVARLDPACDALLSTLSVSSSDQVVIVSDRNIFDIAERITIPGVIVGGCNGIEWQLPSGNRVGTFREHEDYLIRCRVEILPALSKIISGQGVEIEDKLWSITVHANGIKSKVWKNVVNKICTWAIKYGLTCYSGPEQVDIQLIPGFNKSVGISYLAQMFKLDPKTDTVIYAGDDKCDVVALWWTLLFGGTAIMVGNDLQVPGAIHVEDSAALISLIHNILEKDTNCEGSSY